MSHQLLQIKQLFSRGTWEGGKHACSSVLEPGALFWGSGGLGIFQGQT